MAKLETFGGLHVKYRKITVTLPETNIAPEHGWLED